jgi:hypothetical protein
VPGTVFMYAPLGHSSSPPYYITVKIHFIDRSLMFLYVSSWLTLKTKKMQMVCAQLITFFKIYLGAYSKIWKTKESNTTLQEQAIIEHTVLFILVSYATFSFTELWT